MKPFEARIAGRQHYAGVVTPLSMIELVPAPSTADPSAVAIIADGVMAGHIEAGLAPLLAPRLRRGRIVFAAPIRGRADAIYVYIGVPGDRLAGPRPTVVSVEASNGAGAYAVDLRAGFCTCPAGRYGRCKHKALFPPAAAAADRWADTAPIPVTMLPIASSDLGFARVTRINSASSSVH
ncbi:MAG TPA: hypothetical protein VGK17_06950 [Propionicimonas sp.]|jgi:hypothetical protein